MSSTDIQDKSEDAVETVATSSSPQGSSDDSEPVRSPLSSDEFRSVLQQIDALGLTWTADLRPRLRPKDDVNLDDAAFPTKEFVEIQRKYPGFPRELGNVIFYKLTGSGTIRSLIGTTDEAEQKAAIASDLVISQRPDFRSEFFFKYAIKVPYFVDLDWEVVVKAFERNVREMPRIPYALLSLVFRQSMSTRVVIGGESETDESETLTVAVDEHLIDKLIGNLTEAKRALKKAQQLASELNSSEGRKQNNEPSNRQLEK